MALRSQDAWKWGLSPECLTLGFAFLSFVWITWCRMRLRWAPSSSSIYNSHSKGNCKAYYVQAGSCGVVAAIFPIFLLF